MSVSDLSVIMCEQAPHPSPEPDKQSSVQRDCLCLNGQSILLYSTNDYNASHNKYRSTLNENLDKIYLSEVNWHQSCNKVWKTIFSSDLSIHNPSNHKKLDSNITPTKFYLSICHTVLTVSLRTQFKHSACMETYVDFIFPTSTVHRHGQHALGLAMK